MSNLILVDSNYWIRMVALRQDPFALIAEKSDDFDCAINGVIWAEVIRGRADPRMRDRFNEFFGTLCFLNLTPTGWQRAAQLAWSLDRNGSVIPLTDLAIAATALEHDAAVLTFDRHFQRIPGLIVVDDLD